MKTKTLILALGCALTVLAYAGDDALAGRSKSKRTDTEQKVWRYDQMPAMKFARGKLHKDVHSGWKIDNVKVQLAPECIIADDEGSANLYDGAGAMIMGPRVGDTIVAWRIEILRPGELDRHGTSAMNERVQWSESNRNVGEGTGPN